MWTMTTRFATSLAANNHTVANRLDVLLDGALALTVEGKTVVGSTGADVGLLDGRVDVDRTAVRRRGQVTVADASEVLGFDEVGDLLVPLRSEIRPWRGLLYSDRTTETPPADRELIPVGTLVVAAVDKTQWPQLTITGYDRAWLLNRYRFTAPYTIAKGTRVTDALITLLTTKFPANRLTLNIPDLPYTTGLIVWDEQDQPADRAHDLAEAAGLMLYADPMGTFVARSEPSTDDPPVWTYAEGAASTLLPWPAEQLSGEEAENAVVVTSEPQDGSAPLRGYAQNDDPTSVLYAPTVGVIPRFFSSPLITTTEQANKTAATLRQKLGLADVVGISTVVNPALESGDVLYVRATHPASLAAALIADTFSVPLRGAGPQNVTTRARVIA